MIKQHYIEKMKSTGTNTLAEHYTKTDIVNLVRDIGGFVTAEIIATYFGANREYMTSKLRKMVRDDVLCGMKISKTWYFYVPMEEYE
jgi:hypothetical protein